MYNLKTTINQIIEALKSRPQHDEIIRAEVNLSHIKMRLESIVETIISLESEWYDAGSMATAGITSICDWLKELIGSDNKTERIITQKEWNETPRDYKSIIEGQKYKAFLNEETQGTELVPVKLIEDE